MHSHFECSKAFTAFVSALLLSSLLAAPVRAEKLQNSYREGVRLYRQQSYSKAANRFYQAVTEDPGNANAMYYLGLSYQSMGQTQRAAETYRSLIQRFPRSQAASRARSNLTSITVDKPVKQPPDKKTKATPDNRSSGKLYAPERSRIYYQDRGGNFYIKAQLNGRPMEMVFDTGASITLIGKNHLKQAGLRPPAGNPTGLASGVGGSGLVALWNMKVDLKVGDIIRRDFPVSVAEYQAVPLLGQSFFNAFEYTIDRADNSILLVKKGSSYSKRQSHYIGNRNAVPFVVEGNELVVTAQVNGRPYKMYFDTGASSTVFTQNDLKRLGLRIPEDARTGFSSGVGGLSLTYHFPIDRIKLGPIEKYKFNISVVTQAAMPRPLLGQTFYSGWKYTIDNEHKMIHFVRR